MILLLLRIFLIPSLVGLMLPISDNQTITDGQEHLAGRVKSVLIEIEVPASLNHGGYVTPRRMSELISYDATGRKSGTVFYDGNARQLWRWAAKFDSEGRENVLLYYDEKDSIESTTKIAYDSVGSKVEEIDYNSDGTADRRTVYEYDPKRRLRKEIVYKSDGTICVERSYTHNPLGMWASESVDRCDCCPSHSDNRSEYVYDSNGNIVEEKYYESPSRGYRGKRLYSYDRRGNVIAETSYGADDMPGSKLIYTYEFDLAGNWTKRTPKVIYEYRVSTSKRYEIVYRTITYY